ncbi:S9 family peptidase [Polyangium sorediatum]|uniref:S9 family peptidase n=1 Tax=Polyangium sorediatum TaxID=889274 RepID=A0ABT6NRD6_9BACT|nr:S9 family peptidase [Polyangium sorediatum]MDI1430902.1 S9 family peptidase [Polyangium sorediatum]
MSATKTDAPKAFEAAEGTLAVEEVARHPLPGMAIPDQIAFSPDDRLITYLKSPERSLVRQLFVFDPATGSESLFVSPPDGGTTEENVSLAEALRRERQRQREIGVTTYAWATRASRVLVPIKGDLYVQDGPSASLRKLVASGGAPILDPKLSPDGAAVAFVQEAELYVIDATGGAPRQLTSGARGTGKTHGLAEYVAQEEMARHHGYWWSTDGTWLAFTEVDETHIPIYRIVHQGKAQVGAEAEEDHHYPFAGEENARVRLGVVSASGGETVWMDTSYGEEVYLARVHWLAGERLAAEIQNRAQTWLELVVFDLATGARTRLLREETNVWINLHDLLRPLADGGFLWASERTGYRHLYRYDREGTLVAELTRGSWMVDDVRGVDEKGRFVYFTATAASALECHLYAVSFDGGEIRRITPEPGMHVVTCDRACRRFVDVYHAKDRPPTVKLRSIDDGAVLATLHDEQDPRIASLGLTPPEIVSFLSRDGETLHGALYRPPAHFGSGPFPTIVYVYGGPHVQLVTNGWNMTVTMRPQWLRSLGYLVFMVDNRGSARRGLAFEGAIKNRMGSIEVDDQVDGVRWLVAQGLADPARVGVYGWSYGGYMAAMCLARAPETFKVAVAGAPVTHWDGYDTHYTERYMGMPSENPRGYEESSVMRHVENIRGKLMLVHGLIDENVHFRHTARLVNAMIGARKPYDLLLFPDERHMPRRPPDRIYMEELIRDYFVRNL